MQEQAENRCGIHAQIAETGTECTTWRVIKWHPLNNAWETMANVPFTKTRELMRLADMAATREKGVCLMDIQETFGVNHRSAQRMARGLEHVFPKVSIDFDASDNRKWWSLPEEQRLPRMQGIRDDELSALDMSIRRANREGAVTDARALGTLRDRLTDLLPPGALRRAETDAEATLEARGHANHPGPKLDHDFHTLELIDVCLKGPFRIELTYLGSRDTEPRRRHIDPYGVLFGPRCYLVGREPHVDNRTRHFRVDRIEKARCLRETFMRDPDFNLAQHAARSFGSFHSETEFGTVVWRFDSRAAPVARTYVFHPDQVMQDDKDGGLFVTFEASGWLEMVWHLYKWGDTVEVIAPEELKRLVAGYQRRDFPALP